MLTSEGVSLPGNRPAKRDQTLVHSQLVFQDHSVIASFSDFGHDVQRGRVARLQGSLGAGLLDCATDLSIRKK